MIGTTELAGVVALGIIGHKKTGGKMHKKDNYEIVRHANASYVVSED